MGRGNVGPIELQNTVDLVREKLTKSIIDGTLEAGERIVEVQLARSMNISRGPLREACRLMEQQGLLESKPRRGFFVKEFGVDAINNLMQLRIALQVEAARLAVGRMGEGGLTELHRRFDVLRSAIARGEDVETTLDASLDFHRLIFELTDNPRLLRAFDDMLPDIRLVSAYCNRFEQDQTGESDAFYLDNIPPLIAAFVTGDADKAAAAMREYLERVYKTHLSVYRDIKPARAGGQGQRRGPC